MTVRLAALLIAASAVLPAPAGAHFLPRTTHNQDHAINYAFCKRQFTPCRYGLEAQKVARYESGSWWYTNCAEARNGQYLGCFQMGSSERRTYGHGAGVWDQAKAAARYFFATDADWSPWECKPWGCGW